MKNILVIESSPRGNDSLSYQLAEVIVVKLKEKNPGVSVKVHNLNKDPLPHLNESHLAAFFAPPEKHTSADKAAIRHSDAAIAEINEADAILISVPMYNFSIPSSLKAWIDQIVRAGLTFKYGASGQPEGLIKGKKVYLAISSGGVYSDGPMKAYDFVEPYLRGVLGFLGMTDISTFRVEGTSIPGVKETALAKGVESVQI
jgi:FMN-dependent NADH-azoreductase